MVARAATTGGSVRLRDMSAQMKDVRQQMNAQIEEDERLKVLMAGLRGSNMDSSDFASVGVQMNLVEMERSDDDTEQLPLTYLPDEIAAYWWAHHAA